MSREFRRAAVMVGREHGSSPQARQRMNEANEKLQWTSVCKRCGVVLKGTLLELRAHNCSEGRGIEEATRGE